MFDFLGGLGGGLTSFLPSISSIGSSIGSGFGGLLGGFLGGDKATGNMQQAGGNYLLDNMTPEVGKVFQGMGVNVDPSSIGGSLQQGAAQGGINPEMLKALSQSGLLEQSQAPQFSPMQIAEYNPRQQIQPVDLQQYYRNLMSSRQGIL